MNEINYRVSTDHPLPISQAIAEIVAALRKQILSQLVCDLITALEAEGYYFDQLIDSLADYADSRSEWDAAAKCLDQAASELLDIRKPRRKSGDESAV